MRCRTFGIVVVLVLGALGFRDRKETDFLQLICSVSLIAKRSGFSRTRTRTTTSTRTTPQIRNLGSTVHKSNLPYSTVIFSCAAPVRPVACSSHSPGASCQKKRPSRRGNTGTQFIYHCTSFPIVAV